MEARWVTGQAKNLIAFATQLRASSSLPPVELSVATFQRPSAPAGPFLSALESAEIPVHIIRERCAGDPLVVPRLWAIVHSARPDILQTHNSKSHFLLRATGLSRRVPWIAFHHGFTASDAKDRFYNHIGRWALRGAPRIVTVCRAFSADLCRLGIPASRISVRHNMVFPFTPPPADELAALRARLGISADTHVVLAVGRLSAEKGHADLLEAVALLRASGHPAPIRLVVVGDGPERPALEQRCAALNLSGSVTFTGQQAAVAPYYGIAGVFVLPSHSEGSPNVLLEAMAAGLPIVSTAAGGAAELVSNDETALVVDCRDPRALSRAIGRLLEDPPLAGRLAAAAQLASREYTPEAYTASLVSLYAAAVGTEG
jgi:glycosyltransferase involved in cell wall biosynthesis